MFIDHKRLHAAASATFCVRYTVGSLLACCGLLGSAMAQAGPFDRGGANGGGGGGGQAPVREVSRDVQREMMAAQRGGQLQRAGEVQGGARMPDPRSYEARAEEQRRIMQETSHNAEMSRRAGRLTPDERRDLRRQINEAGQDIYAHPPRH